LESSKIVYFVTNVELAKKSFIIIFQETSEFVKAEFEKLPPMVQKVGLMGQILDFATLMLPSASQ